MATKRCFMLASLCLSFVFAVCFYIGSGYSEWGPILQVGAGLGVTPEWTGGGMSLESSGASLAVSSGADVAFRIADAPRSSDRPTPPAPPGIYTTTAPTSASSGDKVNADQKCPGPMVPPRLDEHAAKQLLKEIGETCAEWGYNEDAKDKWANHKGRRVLDVGMGQGPIGVIAVHKGGVRTYTGLDPALCIDKPAKTRYRKIGRTFGEHQCAEMLQECSTGGAAKVCEAHERCADQLRRKYQLFPFTGLQMMQALPGKLVLLPGTFDTIEGSGALRRGDFDVATMNAVTEHLPDVRVVVEGIFNILEPGQLFCASHHNYYGWAGHHMYPQTPAVFDKSSAAQRDFANWRHVDADSLGAAQQNTNRVRLGDLIALIDVYFDCRFHTDSYKGVAEAVQKRLGALTARGFSKEELVVEHMQVNCVRRTSPVERHRIDDAVWFHPALDGSYRPQKLPSKFADAMKKAILHHTEKGLAHPKC